MATTSDVFIVHHDNPEILAYAMAKYSRSSLSFPAALESITDEKAANFMETFYFDYGHKSIADLAHVAMAIERLSILAAIELEDEQRWDGQERSTRYQDFSKRDYFTPDFEDRKDLHLLYDESIKRSFDAYDALNVELRKWYQDQNPFGNTASDMTREKYMRIINARAFDVARYMLPVSVNTSLGQIVSARTLEAQISRLRSSLIGEIRDLGEALAEAATSYPRGVPTLVKYAKASTYLRSQRTVLKDIAKSYFSNIKDPADKDVNTVHLAAPASMLEELVATLIYSVTNRRYQTILDATLDLSERTKEEIVHAGLLSRQPFDEIARQYRCGYGYVFDISMDIGGYRDLHRHRRCIQIAQDWTLNEGFELPEVVKQIPGDIVNWCNGAFQKAAAAYQVISRSNILEAKEAAKYVFPLALRNRALFKMDLAELVYITELRTKPAGHFAYRNIAFQMYEAAVKQTPMLEKCFNVTRPDEQDFFNR